MLSDLDIYLFDLQGYLLIEQALSREEVAALNAGIDAILPLKRGEWAGYVHGHAFSDNDGINLQQIYEGGEPFERLIDHPSWIEKVKYFVGVKEHLTITRPPCLSTRTSPISEVPVGRLVCIRVGTKAQNELNFAFIMGASSVGRSTS